MENKPNTMTLTITIPREAFKDIPEFMAKLKAAGALKDAPGDAVADARPAPKKPRPKFKAPSVYVE